MASKLQKSNKENVIPDASGPSDGNIIRSNVDDSVGDVGGSNVGGSGSEQFVQPMVAAERSRSFDDSDDDWMISVTQVGVLYNSVSTLDIYWS